jgi:hypothetical protein
MDRCVFVEQIFFLNRSTVNINQLRGILPDFANILQLRMLSMQKNRFTNEYY